MTNEVFFDEMNILQSDKELRIKMCNELSNSIFEELNKNKEKENELRRSIAFTILFLLVKYELIDTTITIVTMETMMEEIINGSVIIENNTDEVMKILNEVEFDANSISSTTIEDLELKYTLSKERADFLARNITNKYNNMNNHNIAKKNGAKFHIWKSEKDSRVRASHSVSDEQKKKIDEPFLIGGYYMMYPMDSDYGAPASEIINCRCTETYTNK